MRRRLPSLTTQIVIALLVGFLIGWQSPALGRTLQLLADIFLRLVLVIIAPLVFSTLVVGIAGSGAATAGHKLGAMALRAFVFFLVLSLLAIVLGFVLGNVLQPGAGLRPPYVPEAEAPAAPATKESFWVRIFPTSVIDAMARGDILQIVIFSLLFAGAIAAIGERGRPVISVCSSLADVMYKFTDYVMAIAPLGVLGAVAAIVGRHGIGVVKDFVKLTLGIYGGLGALVLVVFGLVAVGFRLPLGSFARAVKEPFAIAFATTSSAAALPKAMEAMEGYGVPRRIVAFVLPTGYSFNLTGSALFLGVTALFVAQAYRVPLSLAQQGSLLVTLFVVGKGVPLVPRGSLIVLVAGLNSFGFPAEVVAQAFGVLLAVDQILDMPRTGVNVIGNCLATAVVARWEGAFGEQAVA